MCSIFYRVMPPFSELYLPSLPRRTRYTRRRSSCRITFDLSVALSIIPTSLSMPMSYHRTYNLRRRNSVLIVGWLPEFGSLIRLSGCEGCFKYILQDMQRTPFSVQQSRKVRQLHYT